MNKTDTGDVLASLASVREEIGKIIIGQQDVLDMLMAGILAGGHVLLEGVPGTAKTLMIRALSHTLGGSFKRIQFTPDLMPSDITGTRVYNLRDQSFEFHKGPIFCDFLLADEINRTPAKTQSALLEAMQERSVTIDVQTHRISDIFTVFATQNPIEYEGTYPLPEAQSDRFLLKVLIDYPSAEEEDRILDAHHRGMDVVNIESAGIRQVLKPNELHAVRQSVTRQEVEAKLLQYIRSIVRATREDPSVLVGGGPRASIGLLNASKAIAALRGRRFVIPDDVKYMADAVLRHRIVFRPEAEMDGMTTKALLASLFKRIEVPR